MAITKDDIKLYKSQDMTADPAAGGGFMGTEIIVSGEAHNVHGPISRKDRLQGDIDAKKVWINTTSTDTGSYEDPHSIVRPPFDSQVSTLLIPATDYGDHLQDIIDYLERYFVVAQPAGSAGLDKAASAGEQMISFVLVHREYTPHYDTAGNPVWTTKVDAKYTLDVAINELLYIGTEGGNGEFVQIQRVEFHTEELKDSDGTHFYYKKYMILTIASPLLHDHLRGEVPKRTDRNPAWACYGAMELSEDVEPGANTLPVLSTKARLAPVMTRASSILKQPVLDAPSYATNVVVERAGSSVTVPMTPQHQISTSVPVDGSFYTIGDLPDSVPGSVEIHYPSGGNWYTAREDEASGNLTGEGSGTVTRVAGTGITLSCSQPPDGGAHILIYLVRAHGFEVHSKSEILGAIESDSTPIGSHDEVGPGELVWEAAASAGNTGEAFEIPGGSTGAMTLALARDLIPEMGLEVWKKVGNTYSRILRLSARGMTDLSATASGYAGVINYGARQIDVSGPITGDSLHVIYKSGGEAFKSAEGSQALPPEFSARVSLGMPHVIPGSLELWLTTSFKKYENGAWKILHLSGAFTDESGVLRHNPELTQNLVQGGYFMLPAEVGFTMSVDYAAGEITMASTSGYVFYSGVSLSKQVQYAIWNTPSWKTTQFRCYDYFADNGPFEPAGQVSIKEDLTPHAITPGTLTLFEGNSATGPWTQIGSDNGQGMVSTGKGAGTLSYAEGTLQLSWNEPGFDKHLKAGFTEERHVIDYATRFVAALDFGITNVFPGSVAGEYVAKGQRWLYRGTPDGQLVLDRSRLPWGKGEDVLAVDYINSEFLTAANGFFFLSSMGDYFSKTGRGVYLSSDGKDYSPVTLPGIITEMNPQWYCGMIFDGEDYWLPICLFSNEGYRLFKITDNFSAAEEAAVQNIFMLQMGPHGLLGVSGHTLHRYTGGTWYEVTAPSDPGNWTYVFSSDTTDVVILLSQTRLYWSRDLILWNPVTFDNAPPTVVAYDAQHNTWCVGAGTQVFKSTDLFSWAPVGDHFFGCGIARMDSANGRVMVVVWAGDGGPYYCVESLDGGDTWSSFSLPDFPSGMRAINLVAGTEKWAMMVYTLSRDTISYGTPDRTMVEDGATAISTVGTIDYAAGTGTLKAGDIPSTVRMDIALTNEDHIAFADFTRGGAPVTPGSYLLTAKALDGSLLTAVGQDATSDLGGDATGVFNPELGLAVGEFTKPFDPATLQRSFNYKAAFKPSSSGGVNTTSLPLNGLVPVVGREDILIVSDRQRYQLAIAIDDVVISLTLEDSRGWPPELPDPCTLEIGDERLRVTQRVGDILTVERGVDTTVAAAHDKGAVVTLLTYTEEMNVAHTVTDTQVFTANNLTHPFSAGAEVLSALQHGASLQAAVTAYHTQSGWDGATWQDTGEYTGDPAAGTFDYVNYPIDVDNLGAMTDRWLAQVKGLSPLTLEVRGERHGVVMTSANGTADINPLNPRGGQLFSIPAGIWGAGGHQVGEVYRFDTRGTEKPYWSVRVVNAQASDATDDGCIHETRGDVAV